MAETANYEGDGKCGVGKRSMQAGDEGGIEDEGPSRRPFEGHGGLREREGSN